MHRLLAACSLLFLLPFAARAEGAFVSEVAWAGSSASLADEWFEICAAPGTDLSGWSIEGAASSPIILPEGSAIPARGAFLVANYAADDAKSTLAAEPDLVTTAVALSNSALAIVLRDASGAVVDTAGDGGAPPAGATGDAKASMERAGRDAPWLTATAAIGFDEGAPEFGTPGICAATEAVAAPADEESATGSATALPETAVEDEVSPPTAPPVEPMSPMRLSEIYPSPLSGEEEWIELVNPSSVGEFLDGWTVEDAAGTKTRLSGLLLPWGRLVIGSPKGSLNNDGDTVVLKDALGRELDRVAYGKTAKGHAVMRVELQEAFVTTLTPTPGAPNIFTEEAAPAETPASTTRMPPAVDTIALPAQAPTAIAAAVADAAPKPAIVAAPAKPAMSPAKPKAAAKTPSPKYKGEAYAATVAVPPGVYAKTRAYVLIDGVLEELRFSKGVSAPWKTGDRIAFVAQSKTEGAVAFLLANPNSVRVTGADAADYAPIDAWPDAAGGYRFIAEVVAIRGTALEVKLGGIEGDVLALTGSSSALAPGDLVRIEGFVAPGARPRVVLPHAQALTLEKAHVDEPRAASGTTRLPVPLAAGLTGAAGAVGLAAYLRAQRIRRLALTQTAVEPVAWE